MRQAGRYLPEYRDLRARAGSFLDLCFDPVLATEATLQPVRRFEIDAAILFSDILLLPHALGQRLEFRENEGPVLDPVRTAKAVAGLDVGGFRRRLAAVYEAISRVKRDLGTDVALIGFAGAPWTVATYMVEGRASRDYVHAKGWALRAPGEFAALLDLLVDCTAEHLVAQADAGVEAVQIFDSWAGAVPAPMFRRLCLDPVRAIAKRVKAAHPNVAVIAFPRGAGLHYALFAACAEIDAVSIDPTVPLEWARDELQREGAVQGNLDPVALLAGGAAMRDGVDGILATLGGGPLVFNLGHGVLPETPPDHVAELVDLVKGRARDRTGSA